MSRAEQELAALLEGACEALEAEAAEVEAWVRRAVYWRQVAAELASGDREPYPVPGRPAVQALDEQAPRTMRWEPGPVQPTPLDSSRLARWWLRGTRALGRADRHESPERGIARTAG